MSVKTRAAATAQAQYLNRATKRSLGIKPGFAAPRPQGGCRFIAGDPREVMAKGEAIYCGKPAQPNSAYCEAHHARCYTRAQGPGWIEPKRSGVNL
ncbi:MAG TPA: hypothetical protein VKV96_20495 [Roseiarcus sp.]|nr:hypothetical protein [Roseiarcus sp.]